MFDQVITMKQLILLMISCLSLVACGNGNAKQEREKEDSGVADKENTLTEKFSEQFLCQQPVFLVDAILHFRDFMTSYSGRLIFPVPKMGRLPKSMK